MSAVVNTPDSPRLTPTLLALALSIAVSAGAQEGAVRAMLDGARCADAARRQLAAWDANLDSALADPPGPEGTRGVRAPTGTLGVWVQVLVEPGGAVSLARVSATGRERFELGSACEARTTSERVPAGAGVGLTDDALASRLARGDAGVILVWSPHMPLSVDQYSVLAEVTREMGLALVAVLDPAADAAYAQRVAGERGLPEAALQPLGGIELAFRGMTTHAPSVQAFSGGRLVGPVLYGYRAADTARLAIRGVLDQRPPPVRP
ncbi:MAG: hypothetical protein IT179_14000 [Acidobacteria bacterium]|nr:hypothetical protein [Acidobacteriota bacterium]